MSVRGLAEGVCPKCDNTAVLREEAVLQGASGAWSLQNNEVVTFICGRCGFMELYHKGKTVWK